MTILLWAGVPQQLCNGGGTFGADDLVPPDPIRLLGAYLLPETNTDDLSSHSEKYLSEKTGVVVYPGETVSVRGTRR